MSETKLKIVMKAPMMAWSASVKKLKSMLAMSGSPVISESRRAVSLDSSSESLLVNEVSPVENPSCELYADARPHQRASGPTEPSGGQVWPSNLSWSSERMPR